ncbi:crossover junction endodeoxyribonuclease RuvC [Candidatus Roizmanbacteria bacterium]|nr:crossover junction endodeoxyribonuclease RuvC [Candidatus Roizmanbacteria bacterium]
MIILGIDPGIARTGWGVVKKEGNSVTAIKYGCIATEKELEEEKRLVILHQQLKILIDAYEPAIVAVEKLFFASNAKTALTVGQARGVVLLTAGEASLPLFAYTPLQVKLAITGYGRADKQQIQRMVQSMLQLPEIPKPDDMADALAVAITHAFTNRVSG